MYHNIQKVDEGNTCNMLSEVVSLCLCLSLFIFFSLTHTCTHFLMKEVMVRFFCCFNVPNAYLTFISGFH